MLIGHDHMQLRACALPAIRSEAMAYRHRGVSQVRKGDEEIHTRYRQQQGYNEYRRLAARRGV